MNILEKLISKKCPGYDFNRYHFNKGDIVKLSCGAVIVVEYSCLEYVQAWIHKRSLTYRDFTSVRIFYNDLPYFEKGTFTNYNYSVQKRLKWRVGDIILDPKTGVTSFLYEETRPQEFYAFVLKSDNKYYMHTHVFVPNPYREYINYG